MEEEEGFFSNADYSYDIDKMLEEEEKLRAYMTERRMKANTRSILNDITIEASESMFQADLIKRKLNEKNITELDDHLNEIMRSMKAIKDKIKFETQKH